MITTSEGFAHLIQFHNTSSQNHKNCNDFSRFNYFGSLSWNRILTSHRACSVGGSAMHMKCPDDVGREAGIGPDRENPRLEGAKTIPGLPVMTDLL